MRQIEAQKEKSRTFVVGIFFSTEEISRKNIELSNFFVVCRNSNGNG